MRKIFRYECRRLLWNKFFIGLAVVLVWLAVRKVEPVKRRSAKKTEH